MRKRGNELEYFVKRFVSIKNDPKAQLDIYRETGEVLFQLFKTKNVLNWSEQFDFTDEKGHVIVISFSKSKTDNGLVLIRFIGSSWFNSFVKMSEKMGDSYYFYFPGSFSEIEVSNMVNEMFYEFYGTLKNVRFELASW